MSFNAVAQESTNTVSISELDEAPVYPRCKGDSNAEKRKCMSAKITQFIGRNFDKKIANNLGLFGRQKIKIFLNDFNGAISDLTKALKNKYSVVF